MRIVILDSPNSVTQFAADEVCSLLKRHQNNSERTVLGLATGGTPLGLYRELIERCALGEISFAQVETFNLDAPPSEDAGGIQKVIWKRKHAA